MREPPYDFEATGTVACLYPDGSKKMLAVDRIKDGIAYAGGMEFDSLSGLEVGSGDRYIEPAVVVVSAPASLALVSVKGSDTNNTCHRCGRTVVTSPSSYKFMESQGTDHLFFLCLLCLDREEFRAAIDSEISTAEQDAELQQEIGMDHVEAKRRIKAMLYPEEHN